jgi:hypothetical protein
MQADVAPTWMALVQAAAGETDTAETALTWAVLLPASLPYPP